MTLTFRAAFFVAACGALSAPLSCADNTRKIDFEFTGRVLDADTKEPIEGAYVVASYKIQRAGPAAVASFCVKTLGMYTGKDGTYHFPVEKLDGRNPYSTNAIKPGYFWKTSRYLNEAEFDRQDKGTYSNRDIYLRKQNPAEPAWRLSNGEEVCTEARTREAAAAGVTFMRAMLGEYRSFNASEKGVRALENQIGRYDSLPSELSSQKERR